MFYDHFDRDLHFECESQKFIRQGDRDFNFHCGTFEPMSRDSFLLFSGNKKKPGATNRMMIRNTGLIYKIRNETDDYK